MKKYSCEIKKIEPINLQEFENREKIMNALSNKVRLAILEILIKYGEVCTCELEQALNLSQPAITNHILKLYNAGLIKRREDWKYTYYSIKDEYLNFIKFVLEYELK